MNQRALLLDFQGEMMGHGGEIYFAVIKAISLDSLGLRGLCSSQPDGEMEWALAGPTADTAAVSTMPVPPGLPAPGPTWDDRQATGEKFGKLFSNPLIEVRNGTQFTKSTRSQSRS